MFNLVLSVLIIVLGSYLIARLRIRYECRKALIQRTLVEQWRNVRNQRLAWRKQHAYIRNPFDSDEYERLWDIEIGACALLEMYCDGQWEISYQEYRGEREKFELEQEGF